MHVEDSHIYHPGRMPEPQILSKDMRKQYREIIARITMDSMLKFVGILDAKGIILEVNARTLDAGGFKLSDIEGKPLWDTYWWQVSEEINKNLREFIVRAAGGEFVRWEVEIYGRAGSTETISIDASLSPVNDEYGDVVFIIAEGRDITVLSYSMVTEEDQPTSRVDLNEIVKNIETDLEILILEKKVTFKIAALPIVEGIPVLLYQLIYNLVNNSIKFAKSNEPPVISMMYTIEQVDDKPFAKIKLKDNGIGFAPEYSEKIFATFTRLNPKDKYEATGLGLALCKKIVQRHDGFIYVHGEINNGAEFTILLPFN